MCYPKPGPRCSTHAALQVTLAQQKVMELAKDYLEIGDRDSPSALQLRAKQDASIKKREQALEEYKITPAGLRSLQRSIQEARNESQLQGAKEKLNEYTLKREVRLAALKPGVQQRVHRPKPHVAALRDTLSSEMEVLKEIGDEHPHITAAIQESANWSARLNDQEVDTLRWYTQNGYDRINKWLTTDSSDMSEEQTESIREAVHHMDSALAKQPPGVEKVLYRRHFLYGGPDKMFIDVTPEVIDERFTPGSTYEPGFYMSTSFDPDNAPPDDGGVAVFLEIKSSSAVSIAAASARGSTEKEYLIPRHAKFRVVSNNSNVVIENRKGKQRKLRVVQLEEIPTEGVPASKEAA